MALPPLQPPPVDGMPTTLARWMHHLWETVRTLVVSSGTGLFTAGTGLTESPAGTVSISAANVTKLANTSNTNSGDVTLAAVGAVPNANAASLSAQALTLQPASGSFPGVMTAAQFTKLAGIATGATAEVDAAAGVSGRVNTSTQTLGAGTKKVDALEVTGKLAVGNTGPARTMIVRGSDTGNGIARFGNSHASGISAITLEDTAANNKVDLAFAQSAAALAASNAYLRIYDCDFRIYRDVAAATSLQATFLNNGNVTLEAGNMLGLGIAPTFHLQASGTVAANGHVSARFQNLSSAGNSQVACGNSSSAFALIEIRGTTEGTANLPPVNYATFRGSSASSGAAIQAQGSGTPIEIWTNNAGTHAKRAEFPGAGGLQVGGVDVLTQTNTVAGVTNKTLTAPTINACTTSGTWSGNSTFSGNLTLSGSNLHSGLMTRTSGVKVSQRATTATTVTMGTADETILASANSGAVTVNLTAAATAGAGRRLTVVKTDASGNAVTLDGSGSETINGAATRALAAQHNKVTIESDGTNWIEVA